LAFNFRKYFAGEIYMVNKKNNPEKGLRTVTIEFSGKTRQLHFGHKAIGKFEEDANIILRSMQVIEPGNMLFADRIMDGWLGNARIFSQALYYGLKHEDKDLSLDIIDAAIDSFIEAGGQKQDLVRAIITAYRYATNPSTVASLQRSWQISNDRQAILTASENEYMDTVEKAIQDAKAKKTDGLPSSDSPS
jgi:hypothetical protein